MVKHEFIVWYAYVQTNIFLVCMSCLLNWLNIELMKNTTEKFNLDKALWRKGCRMSVPTKKQKVEKDGYMLIRKLVFMSCPTPLTFVFF